MANNYRRNGTPIKFGKQNVCERLLPAVLLVTTFQSAAIAPKGVHPAQSPEGPNAPVSDRVPHGSEGGLPLGRVELKKMSQGVPGQC